MPPENLTHPPKKRVTPHKKTCLFENMEAPPLVVDFNTADVMGSIFSRSSFNRGAEPNTRRARESLDRRTAVRYSIYI